MFIRYLVGNHWTIQTFCFAYLRMIIVRNILINVLLNIFYVSFTENQSSYLIGLCFNCSIDCWFNQVKIVYFYINTEINWMNILTLKLRRRKRFQMISFSLLESFFRLIHSTLQKVIVPSEQKTPSKSNWKYIESSME